MDKAFDTGSMRNRGSAGGVCVYGLVTESEIALSLMKSTEHNFKKPLCSSAMW